MIYCVKQVPRMGRVVRLLAKSVEVQELGGRLRHTRYERQTDLRAPSNLVRVVESPALTAKLLRLKQDPTK